MKQLAIWILSLALAVSLCACGGERSTEPSSTDNISITTMPSQTTLPETTAPEITIVPETTAPVTEPQTQPTQTGHSHSYVTQSKAATCALNGYTLHTCTDCGHMYTSDLVEPTGHIYQERKTAPTCTQDGYTTFTCTVCGASHDVPEYGTAAHKLTVQITQPTCTEAGYAIKTCTVCEKKFRETASLPLGHSYTIHITLLPACTQGGHTEHTCDRCGDSYIDSYTQPNGHSYTIHGTQLPSCIQMGYTEHTCDACGYSYFDSVTDAIGHIWGAWTTVEEPTHTSAGREERKCTVCNEIQSHTTNALPMTDSQKAQEVLRLVNIQRKNAGVSPLQYCYDGQAAADTRAVEIKTVFEHTRPDGRSWFSVLADYGISYRTAGENIASGFTSPEAVVQGWMSSPGHRENILSADFTMLVVGARNNCWVQLFLG